MSEEINNALQIEALLFASEDGVSLTDIQQIMRDALDQNLSLTDIQGIIEHIAQKHQTEEQQLFDLHEIDGRFQFLSKPVFHHVIQQLKRHKDKKKLSQSAMETLSIIAYQQPITKLEVEQIRGVNCDYSIQRLLEKKLIQISGKADSIGKPLLYSTSTFFMDYFGLRNIKELPQLKDIINEENSIGNLQD